MAKVVPIDANRKHMSRAQREARANAEARLRAPADRVRPPSWLPKDAKKLFRALAKELLPLGLVSNLDVTMLSVFANTLAAYHRLNAILERDGSVIDYTNKGGATNPVSHPAFIQQKQLSDQLRMLASEFGLTTASRARLAIPQVERKEPDAFEQMFGDVIPSRHDAR